VLPLTVADVRPRLRRHRFEFTRRAIIPVVAIALAIAGVLVYVAVSAVRSTVRDSNFELSLEASEATFRAEEPIPVHATLTYLGPDQRAALSSEYPEGVYFDLEQLDGPLDMSGGGSRLICHASGLQRAAPATILFQKAGAFSSDDPYGDFWQGYFSDPTLRLPAGLWRVTAHLKTAIGTDCATADHELATAVSFKVEP
jgi:hypothetical protein